MDRIIVRLIPLACLLAAVASHAQQTASPAQRLNAVLKEWTDARTAYYQATAKLTDALQNDPEVGRLGNLLNEREEKAMATAMEIAKAEPQSVTAFDALEWVVMNDTASPVAASAIEMLAVFHAGNPRIGRPIATIAYYIQFKGLPTYAPAGELMKAAVQINPDRTARAQAAGGLARRAKWVFELADAQGTDDRDRLAQEAEKAMQSVIAEYGDCRDLREGGSIPAKPTVAEELQSELYEITHLRTGKPAPDTEGEDLNGVRFKLSDERGKVVMLVFWASWCGPCMAEVPAERDLVERFRGRPFALIGINADAERAKAIEVVAAHRIPWRSFWNGPGRSVGPVSTLWNVRGWPTVYVIGADGVIRHKNLGTKDWEPAIEKLVSEVESSRNKPT